MKGLRYLVCGVALVASVGVSSASAANWDPVNTTLHGSQVGTGTLRLDPSGATVSCVTGTTDLRANSATPSVASTTAASNPVQFGTCTSLGFSATVTTFGTWDFTGVSTTSVTATARPATAGGPVATITIPAVGCNMAIHETTIVNNTWHQTLGQLTTTADFPIPVTVNSEPCTTLLGTTGTLSATFSVPGATLT